MKYKDERLVENLYKKTRELIISRGVKGWNMSTLASELGMARSTVYRMVDSKETLILEVVLDDIKKVEKGIKSILLRPDKSDVIDRISELLTDNVPLMLGDYMTDVLLEYPSIDDHVKKNEENIRKSIKTFIKTGQTLKKIKKDVDADTLFETLVGIILQFVRLEYSGEVLTKKVKQSFQYVFRGIEI